ADTYVLAPLASDLGGQLYTLSNTRMQVTFVWADGLGASPDPKPTSNEVIFAVDHATGHYVMCQVWDSSEQSGVQLNGNEGVPWGGRASREQCAVSHDAIVPATPLVK